MQDNKKNLLPCAMTVDVEDYYHVAAFGKNIASTDWDNYTPRVVDNTRALLRLFEQHELQATFFVLGWVAERQPKLVKEIQAQGHEIASHGYSHQLIYNQTPDVFADETRRSKQILEDIIGEPIHGYRASSYSITHKSLWALDILVEHGFTWDSSIFPIRHDKYGIANSPTRPYEIQTTNGQRIREIPMTTASLLGMRMPAAGGGYFRLFPYWLSRHLLQKASSKVPSIFYLHPWEIDADQPRVEGASLLSRFRHYNNLDKCYGRLENLIRDFQFTTVASTLSDYNITQTMPINELRQTS